MTDEQELTLRRIIAETDRGQEPEVVTTAVLDLVLTKHRKLAKDLLSPIVHDEVRRLRRLEVAEAEGVARSHDAADASLGRKELLRMKILVPGDGYVVYGDATAPQLRARAEYLRRQAMTLVVNAESLEADADLIEAHEGATCLNDLVEVPV